MRYFCKRSSNLPHLVYPARILCLDVHRMNVTQLINILFGSRKLEMTPESLQRLSLRARTLLPLMSPLQINQVLFGFASFPEFQSLPLLKEISAYLLTEQYEHFHLKSFWQHCTANDLVLFTKFLLRYDDGNSKLFVRVTTEVLSQMDHLITSDLAILLPCYVCFLKRNQKNYSVFNQSEPLKTVFFPKLTLRCVNVVQKSSPEDFSRIFCGLTHLYQLVNIQYDSKLLTIGLKYIDRHFMELDSKKLQNCIMALLENFDIEFKKSTCKANLETTLQDRSPQKSFLKFYAILEKFSNRCFDLELTDFIKLMEKIHVLNLWSFKDIEGLLSFVIQRLCFLDSSEVMRMLEIISKRYFLASSLIGYNSLFLVESNSVKSIQRTHQCSNIKETARYCQFLKMIKEEVDLQPTKFTQKDMSTLERITKNILINFKCM